MGLSGLFEGYLGWFRVIRSILMHYLPKKPKSRWEADENVFR
jgi:hypothetical protein